jgi:TonB family protein
MSEFALNRLRQAVLAAKADDQEVAGFLLGVREGGDRRGAPQSIIAVDTFALLEAESRQSRLFSYAEAGPRSFEQQLRSHGGQRRAVGFFRSNRRPESRPTDDDIKLLKIHFGSAGVLLLIDGAGEQCLGTYYNVDWRNPSVLRASYPIFLDRQFHDGRAPDAGPPARPSPARHNPAPPRDELDLDGIERHSGAQGWNPARIGLVLAGVGLVALGGIQYGTMRLLVEQRREAPKTSDSLDLKTERAGADNQWKLSWNRSSTWVRKAGKGHISILDGYLQKDIDLSANDVQSGSIVYSAISDDVRIRLELLDLQAGRAVSEAIRVLTNPWPDPANAAIHAPPDLPRLEAAGIRRAMREADAGETSHGSSEHSAEYRPQRRQSGQEAARAAPEVSESRASRPFTPPTVKPVIIGYSVNDFPVPPALRLNTTAAPLALALQGSAIPPRPPASEAVQSTPATEEMARASTPPAQTPVQSADATDQRSAQVEPPILLHRTEPQYPRLAYGMRLEGTVRISATVGTDGHIHDAKILSGSPILAQAGVQAVNNWVYKPARAGGRDVPVTRVIEIKFVSH